MDNEARGGDPGASGVVEEVHPSIGVDGLSRVHPRRRC